MYFSFKLTCCHDYLLYDKYRYKLFIKCTFWIGNSRVRVMFDIKLKKCHFEVDSLDRNGVTGERDGAAAAAAAAVKPHGL